MACGLVWRPSVCAPLGPDSLGCVDRCVVASLRPFNCEQFSGVVGTPMPHSLDVVGERAADRAEFKQSCKLVSFMIKCTWAPTRATGQVFSFKDQYKQFGAKVGTLISFG